MPSFLWSSRVKGRHILRRLASTKSMVRSPSWVLWLMDFETEITIHGLAQPAPATLRRIDKACHLADTLIDMINSPTKRPAKAVAWAVVQLALCTAMDYDARVSTTSAFVPLALRHDQDVQRVVACILGENNLDDNVAQLVRMQLFRG